MSKRKRGIKIGLKLTPELPLEHNKKRLVRSVAETKYYQDAETMDWSERCIAKFVAA